MVDGHFTEASASAGSEATSRKAVHRGAAFGDLDNDGRQDVVVTALEAPLVVWRNVSAAPHHWLLVSTVGKTSNRGGIGAKLRLTTTSGVQYNHANTAVGYGSASYPRVHFGLGRESSIKELRIEWPKGAVQTLRDLPVDQLITVQEAADPASTAEAQRHDFSPTTPTGRIE